MTDDRMELCGEVLQVEREPLMLLRSHVPMLKARMLLRKEGLCGRDYSRERSLPETISAAFEAS